MEPPAWCGKAGDDEVAGCRVASKKVWGEGQEGVECVRPRPLVKG